MELVFRTVSMIPRAMDRFHKSKMEWAASQIFDWHFSMRSFLKPQLIYFFKSSFIIRKTFPIFFSLAWIFPKNRKFPILATNTSCSKVKSPNFRSASTRNLEFSTGLMVWKKNWTSRTQATYPPGFFGKKTILTPVILGERIALTVQKLLHWKDHLVSCQLFHTLCSPNESLTFFELFFLEVWVLSAT